MLKTIAGFIWENLKPLVTDLLTKLKGEVSDEIPKLVDSASETVRVELAKYMPEIIAAVVQAVTKATAQIAVNGVDKITDMIPGQLDDEIIDPVVRDVMGQFSHIFDRK